MQLLLPIRKEEALAAGLEEKAALDSPLTGKICNGHTLLTLYVSSLNYNEVLLEYLLKSGANPELPAFEDNRMYPELVNGTRYRTDGPFIITPFYLALKTKNLPAVKKLINHGIDPEKPLPHDQSGTEAETPLSFAYHNKCYAIVEYLLPLINPTKIVCANFKPNSKYQRNCSVFIDLLFYHRDLDSVKVIDQWFRANNKTINYNAVDQYNETILHEAIFHDIETLKFFLSKKIDPNIIGTGEWPTPHFYLVYTADKDLKKLELLLEAGANPNQLYDGMSLLDYAILLNILDPDTDMNVRLEQCKLLIRYGADVNIRSQVEADNDEVKINTPLLTAVGLTSSDEEESEEVQRNLRSFQFEIILILTQNGANVSVIRESLDGLIEHNLKAFIYLKNYLNFYDACQRKDFRSMIATLQANNKLINVVYPNGNPILHEVLTVAAEANAADVYQLVDLIIKLKFDLNRRNKNGETALDVARKYNVKAAYSLLTTQFEIDLYDILFREKSQTSLFKDFLSGKKNVPSDFTFSDPIRLELAKKSETSVTASLRCLLLDKLESIFSSLDLNYHLLEYQTHYKLVIMTETANLALERNSASSSETFTHDEIKSLLEMLIKIEKAVLRQLDELRSEYTLPSELISKPTLENAPPAAAEETRVDKRAANTMEGRGKKPRLNPNLFLKAKRKQDESASSMDPSTAAAGFRPAN